MTQPRMFGDRYEIGELIGYGGMAEVHRGRDIRLNRDVAIKVLRADLARDPSFLTRFRREAHSAAGLNHPSIVSVYDTGEDVGPDGTTQPFIVMEFVEGRTLRDIVKAEGALPPRRAMEITADICAALEFSHRNGIVHRDIKPANVMITPQGAVKVMDFGIARAVADTSSTVTQTANVIGTAQYLSPEQARGETVDARSDVYSSGCLLYELITGGPPFQGDSPVAVAYQHVRENPVMPSARKPGVPRVLDSIVMKALAKNQLNRYQSAGEMRSDLQRALADQPVAAEAVMTDAERTQFIARTPVPVAAPRRDEYAAPAGTEARHTGLIWAAVVVALLLVIGIGAVVILTGGGGGSNTATVPKDLQGKTAAQVQAALANVDLKYKYGGTTAGPCTDAQKTPVESGACTINPGPGSPVDKNSTVTVAYYAKPKPKAVQVPSVVGMQYNDAQKSLVTAGVDPSDIVKKSVNQRDANGNATANEVIKQDPAGYALLNPGDKITLEVATGKLVLPAVKGKTVNDARSTINDAGFTDVVVGTAQTGADKSKDGQVVDVDPTANGKIAYAPDTKITLTPYQYVKPKPTCTTAPPSHPGPTGPTGPTGPGSPTGSQVAPPTGGTSSSTGLPTCKS